MSVAAPITFEWTGEGFVPLPRLAKVCDEHFVVGQRYALVEHEDRSAKTHNHEFAWLKEAWQSLPERIAADFPTPEHLRKAALIEAGYFDQQTIDAGTQAAALRVCMGIKLREPFSSVVTRGPLVVIRTAKSQSRRTMDKAEFQASKTAIMEVVAALLGVAADELQRAA